MILKKKVGKSKIFDFLHRGTVRICMAVTVLGVISMISTSYNIFTRKLKPKTELSNKELLAGGGALKGVVDSELQEPLKNY